MFPQEDFDFFWQAKIFVRRVYQASEEMPDVVILWHRDVAHEKAEDIEADYALHALNWILQYEVLD